MDRNRKHLVLQRLFWTRLGCKLIELFELFERRFVYVVMNYSLHSETNGEYWLIEQIPEDPVVLDVGFNIGDYTTSVLERRPNAKIYAFDPMRSAKLLYEELFVKNVGVNFQNIALSNTAGYQTFFDYENECSSLSPRMDGNRDGSAPETYEVRVSTVDLILDELEIDHVDLLKIDTEGYDLHVLEGACKVLESKRVGLVMFEFATGWYASRRNLLEACEFIKKFPDYKIYRLFNGFLVPFEWSPDRESRAMGSMFVVKHKDCSVLVRDEFRF